VAGPTGAVTSRRIAPTGLPRRPRLPGARPARGAGVAAAAEAAAPDQAACRSLSQRPRASAPWASSWTERTSCQ